MLPRDAGGLVRAFVGWLAERGHGPVLVARSLAFLAAGRHGVSERELLALLWRDPELRAEHEVLRARDHPDPGCLPPIVWSRLLSELEPYLVERSAGGERVLAFFHRVFAETLAAAFLDGEAGRLRHATLAAHFAATGPRRSDGLPDRRCLAELPYQLVRSGDLDGCSSLLLDFDFCLAKCQAGLSDDLVLDGRRALEAGAGDVRLAEWIAFLQLQSHRLRRASADWPGDRILLQLASEAAGVPGALASAWLATHSPAWRWLRRVGRAAPEAAQQAVLEGHGGAVLGTHPLEANRLASWARDGSVIVWDLESGAALRRFHAPGRLAGALALPHGLLLAWYEDRAFAVLLDLETGTPAAQLEGPADRVDGAAWSAQLGLLTWSGKWTGSGSTVRRDERTLAARRVLPARAEGALLLSGDRVLCWYGLELSLWDAWTGELVTRLDAGPSGIAVQWVVALPGERAAAWAHDSHLWIWSLRTGELLQHRRPRGVPLPDGRLLEWTSEGLLGVVDLGSEEAGGGLRAGVGGVAVDAQRLVTWDRDGSGALWDLASGAALMRFLHPGGRVAGAAALPGGDVVTWGERGGALLVWDGRTGERRARLDAHADAVTDLRVLPDGRILSAARDGSLRLWRAPTQAPAAEREQHPEHDSFLALPDGRVLSWSRSAMRDRAPRLRDPATGATLHRLEGHVKAVSGALITRAGRLLTWSEDRSLRLWDLATGEPLGVLKGHSKRVNGACELDDGRIVSWSQDTTARIFDATTGSCLSELAGGHHGGVEGVLPLRCGTLLSWDMLKMEGHRIQLWDARSGAPVRELEGHRLGGTQPLALGERRLATLTGEELRVWDGLTGELLAQHASGAGAEAIGGGAELLANGWIASFWTDREHRAYVTIWDPAHGLVARTGRHPEAVQGAALLSDGSLATWDASQHFHRWDLRSGAPLEPPLAAAAATLAAPALLAQRARLAGLAPLVPWRFGSGQRSGPGAWLVDGPPLLHASVVGWTLPQAIGVSWLDRVETRVIWHGEGAIALALRPDGRIVIATTDGSLAQLELLAGRERAAWG